MMPILLQIVMVLSFPALSHTRPNRGPRGPRDPDQGARHPLLFQGDIVMTGDMVSRILQDVSVPSREKRMISRMWKRRGNTGGVAPGGRGKRAAVKEGLRIWGDGSLQRVEGGGYSYGVIPYRFDESIDQWKRGLIQGAMSHWEARTRVEGAPHHCVKFLPWTDQTNYLNFVSTNGCWSKVGRMSEGGAQDLALGVQCGSQGLISHEIGHALGFFHEQSRPDRDDWIRIVEENVKPDRHYNFIKYGEYLVDSRGLEYDYSSIMHYALDAFSKNGGNTLEPTREVDEGVTIGQRDSVSEGDVEQIRRMYGCVKYNEPTTEQQVLVLTEKPGKWYWDFRNAKWIWKTD